MSEATRRGGRTLAVALRAPEWSLLLAILAVLAGIYVKQGPPHSFFDWPNLNNVSHTIALLGVLAVGAAVIIISGGIDLSVGSVVALSAVVAAKLMTEWLPGAQRSGSPISPTVIAAAIAITLLLGVVIGLLHALFITAFRLPPFIATLATMAGLRSLAIVVSKNQSVNVNFPAFRMFGSDNVYTIPIFLVVAVVATVMMGATVLGRHLYALGGNEAAARLSGLPTARLKMIAYGLSGMLSALGGLLYAGNAGQGKGTMGMSYELFAITAAVVGGCSLSGGVGSIRGTVLGLVLIQIVIKGTGLVVTWIDPTQIEGLVLGTIIVLAVALNQRFRGRG
ncbi:MAG: permease component of ribose/xylose/arabinose/galactoside ABC-type transporter [Planctomycetota bacterium]|nr:permease component of ribose/xylose/arabinose/galactoside ABC-type transporter [Planctomycetota bacterium]